MKAPLIVTTYLAAASMLGMAADTVTIATPVVPARITASTEYSKDQTVQHLIDHSGLSADLHHDADQGAHTMWHSVLQPRLSAPAAGLPAGPAWVRLDLEHPAELTEILLWNHNQVNLTNRGFRNIWIYGSSDSTTWLKLAGDGLELKQGGEVAQTIKVGAKQPLAAIIIAAESNWGGDCCGLSEVKLRNRREVTTDAIPAPEAVAITGFPFVWDPQGKPHRQVEISFADTPLYVSAEAVVTCNGQRTSTHLDFSPQGRITVVLPLPAGVADTRAAAAEVAVTVTTPRWTRSVSGTIAPLTDWPHLKEVIVVCKTHFDIGYTHRVNELVDYYRTGMIDRAMDIMDQSKNLPSEQQFAWTGPGWVMSKVLDEWEGQTPARRQRLDDYVKAGRFQFHALPFTLESDACEPEEMARGFGFTSALCRKYNMPLPRSGKMTDVPSHGGALATVLAHGGVKFMHIGCNWPSGCVKTPGLFWWEGPDESRVLTFYSNTYGTCVPPFLPRWYCNQDPFISSTLAPPTDWTYPIWPAIIVTPDNSGPPKAEQIKALFDDVAKKLPGIRVRMGTMDDFVDAILKEKPDLPVVRGEMPDTWIHGIMCDPGGSKLSRATHPQLAAAEVLHTQLNLWGVAQPPIAKNVALAYEKILLYGEHTWGGAASVNQYGEAFKKLDPKSYANLEASWEDKTDYIRDAERISRYIEEANLKALANAVKTAGSQIVVYNPLPWARPVMIPIAGEDSEVKDVPPCGYLTLPLRHDTRHGTQRKTTAPATLENDYFKVTLDPAKGAITSLVDKRTGREWVDAAEPCGLGSYLNERFTFEQTLNYTMAYQQNRAGNWPHPGMHKPGMISEKQVPYRAATAANGTATIEIKFNINSATIACPADPANHLPATELKITLQRDRPWIDLELTIKDKAKDNWPEADWLCLPFKLASPQFRVYRQLGVMNPATDILPGANRDLFSVGNGVTLTDADGAGIAVCPLDHPLVSLDRPGCWKASKDAGEFTPKKPVVYLNLYNNQWNTNFRYWYPGTWSSRVRLWTFDAKTPVDAVMATPALEARNPLLVTVTTGKGETLPTEQTGVAVSRKGVLVTTFGQNPDGPGTLLRVWEEAGVSGEQTLTIPGKFTRAVPVNLRGEKAGDPMSITGGKLTFTLGKFAPAGFVLE